LLVGTEIYMDELSRKFGVDASYLLKSIRCLRIKNDLRNKIGEILNNNHPKVYIYINISFFLLLLLLLFYIY